jgi:hypothetical protein
MKFAIGFITALLLIAYKPEVVDFLVEQGVDNRIARLGCINTN